MKEEKDEIFLNKINERIQRGDFDIYFKIPFMSRELLYITIKEKLNKKIKSKGTPILNDSEIRECISSVKEYAVHVFYIFLKFGFIIKTESGYKLTEKGKLALKTSKIL